MMPFSIAYTYVFQQTTAFYALSTVLPNEAKFLNKRTSTFHVNYGFTWKCRV